MSTPISDAKRMPTPSPRYRDFRINCTPDHILHGDYSRKNNALPSHYMEEIKKHKEKNAFSPPPLLSCRATPTSKRLSLFQRVSSVFNFL